MVQVVFQCSRTKFPLRGGIRCLYWIAYRCWLLDDVCQLSPKETFEKLKLEKIFDQKKPFSNLFRSMTSTVLPQ
jgi:hypothetical protein